jgi:2-polyprenyl-3-methyl-5-hydroxy-6-metoxy-1,4-benzoquinol methylase
MTDPGIDFTDHNDEVYSLRNIAAVYHSNALAGINEQYHNYLRDSLIPTEHGGSALELGCGKGLWTKVLSERYDELDVVDISPELIEIALKRCNKSCHVTPYVMPIEHFLKNVGQKNKYQHIYMTFILEHLEFPVETLKTVGQLLSKEGSLFIAVPNANSVHRVIAYRAGIIGAVDELSENDRTVGHRRVYARDLLVKQVTQAGFEVVDEGGIGFKPLNLKQLEGLSSEVINGFCASGDLVRNYEAYITIRAMLSNRISDYYK